MKYEKSASLNLNDHIRVSLTDEGRAYLESLRGSPEHYVPAPQPDGSYVMQLHALMELFGPGFNGPTMAPLLLPTMEVVVAVREIEE